MKSNAKHHIYAIFKRIIDFIFALIGIVILSPIMIIIAIAIKLESRGPILFKQVRTGKNGANFNLYKFRSMTRDNNVYNYKNENKMTRVGKFIRKTSLDELPQFINILKGEMSFIGPRPWITDYYDNFTDSQKHRVDVLPGITGLAQVEGRNDISIFDKINYDLEYVNNYSLLMDLKVVFLTIKTLFTQKGAEMSKNGIKNEIQELNENYLSVTGEMPIIRVVDIQKFMG